jgi:hypothetical protein
MESRIAAAGIGPGAAAGKGEDQPTEVAVKQNKVSTATIRINGDRVSLFEIDFSGFFMKIILRLK